MAAVPVLTRVTDKPTIRVIDEATDSPSMSSVVGSETTRSLWADATVTTANLLTGSAVTTINLGTGTNPTISLGGATSQLKSFAGSVVQSQATVQTTNNTVTTAATLALADNTVYLLQATIVGRRSDAAGRAAYVRNACVYREAAGAATLEGTVDTALTRESTAAWDATISVSGNDVLITVKGATGATVNWTVTYTLTSRS